MNGFNGELRGKRASVALGLAIALAIAVMGVTATIGSVNSGRNDYELNIHFQNANGLITGSDVFFGGVKVGTVKDVVADETAPADNANSNFQNPTQTATVIVSIDKQYSPVHQGATAAIRPKSLLGEKYVAMTVGDPGKPAIPDSATLPPSATSVNVELDQLINIFDAPTRAQLQKLIDSLGTGLAGQGRTTNETLQVGQQDLTNLAGVTDVLQARDLELRRIVEALTKITQTLSTDQQRANYPDLLAHSDTVLKTLIAEDTDVSQGIDRMNQFFGILDQGFAGRQADLQQIFADLPTTVSNLDAISAVLEPQGQIGLKIVRAAAPGVVGGDLIFGSQPDLTTYTSDMWTRVMPAQGCITINSRTAPDATGQTHDAPPLTRPSGSSTYGDAQPLCTLPVLSPTGCTGTACLTALAGALCVIEGLSASTCNLFTGGTIGQAVGAAQPAAAGQATSQQPARGALGVPLNAPPAGDPTINNLLGFLLR